MIREAIKATQPALLSQWEARDSGQVYALIMLYDPSAPFEWYVIAQNPENGEELYCIIYDMYLDFKYVNISELESYYNPHGSSLEVADFFRPMRVNSLLERIKWMKGLQ